MDERYPVFLLFLIDTYCFSSRTVICANFMNTSLFLSCVFRGGLLSILQNKNNWKFPPTVAPGIILIFFTKKRPTPPASPECLPIMCPTRTQSLEVCSPSTNLGQDEELPLVANIITSYRSLRHSNSFLKIIFSAFCFLKFEKQWLAIFDHI